MQRVPVRTTDNERERPSHRFRGAAGKAAAYALLLAMTALMLLPFVWMLSASLKLDKDVFRFPIAWIPPAPQWGNYVRIWTRVPFLTFFRNTATLTVTITLLQLASSSLAAYAFAKLQFKGRDFLFLGYIASIAIPWQVYMVPQFIMMRRLDLVDTHLALILLQAFSAFGVFLLRQAMNTVPHDLDQAATLDGAGHFRIFWVIVLPLVRPALATLAVFAFLNTWNSFLWPLIILRDPLMQTLPVALSSLQGQYSTQWDVLMAGSVVSIIPMFALYVFAQKYIVQGVAGTGLK